ncbi:WD40 repeat domain-containing protein [Oscillatoria sp. HE19RPO]|uniref:WD40 repeat domain-containing protein n=1 Tax=Oscillatoria sp. HE19RPO TaxID=2954806 RepID=UPI0020C54E01|nr:WD40 repeat domain-containing protein [Oscillatoria sp. HE19RPO]
MQKTSIFHYAPISGVATLREDFIATAGYDNQVILWNAQSGIPLTRVNHDHLVNQCEFSPDGRLLVSASSDYTARIWSVPEMRLLTVLNGHSDDVVKASFCPSGQRIATCSYDGTLRIFNIDGKCLLVCEGHTGLIETFDWNIDGTKIMSCGTDGTIKIWCSLSGKIKNNYHKFDYDIDTLVSLGVNNFIAGNDKGEIITYINESFCFYQAHKSGIKQLVKYDNLLLSAGYDQEVILWEISQEGNINKICSDQVPVSVWTRSASFINSKTIVFASFGSTYISWSWLNKTWDCRSWQASYSKNSLALRGQEIFSTGDSGIVFKNDSKIADVSSLCNCITLNNDFCFVAGHTGTIFEAFHNNLIFKHTSSINCCCSYLDLEGRQIFVFGAYDGTLIFVLVSHEKLKPQINCINLGCNAIKGIAFGWNSLLCGSADGSLILVDSITKKTKNIQKQAHDGIVNGVTIYKNGFVTVSRDLTIRLWTEDGNLKKILKSRHPKSIKCVATSSDGYLTASGSYGGHIDIYNHLSGEWIGDIKRPTMSGISDINWSDSLSCFVASSYDGKIYYV